MANKAEKSSTVSTTLETIVSCKWAKRILFLISEGVRRPGAITRSIEGLTTKVQNDCLRKMVGLNILERTDYAEIPPRVEYELTDFGRRFIGILKTIEELQSEIETKRPAAEN